VVLRPNNIALVLGLGYLVRGKKGPICIPHYIALVVLGLGLGYLVRCKRLIRTQHYSTHTTRSRA